MCFVVGHRGAPGYEPENTVRSFSKAVRLGVNYIEMDVRTTKDNNLVLMHDRNVVRTTNGKGLVRDLSLQEIRRLDAGKGEKVPLLSEVFELFANKTGIIVEVKEPGTEESILAEIDRYGVKSYFIVSFYHKIIHSIKKKHPAVKCGVIYSGEPVHPVNLAIDAGADLLVPNFSFVSTSLVEEAHSNGVLVQTWTVKRRDVEEMLLMKVDGIASDYPDIVLENIR